MGASHSRQQRRVQENNQNLDEQAKKALSEMRTDIETSHAQNKIVAVKGVIEFSSGTSASSEITTPKQIEGIVDNFLGDKRNILLGCKSAITSLFYRALGSTSAKSESVISYWLTMTNTGCVVRVDAAARTLTSNSTGVHDVNSKSLAWVYSVALVNTDSLTKDEVLYLVDRQTDDAVFSNYSRGQAKLESSQAYELRMSAIMERDALLAKVYNTRGWGAAPRDEVPANTLATLAFESDAIDDIFVGKVNDWHETETKASPAKQLEAVVDVKWGLWKPDFSLFYVIQEGVAPSLANAFHEACRLWCTDTGNKVTIRSARAGQCLGLDVNEMYFTFKVRMATPLEEKVTPERPATPYATSFCPSFLDQPFVGMQSEVVIYKKLEALQSFNMNSGLKTNTIVAIMAHEVGHILGLRHEHALDFEWLIYNPSYKEETDTAINVYGDGPDRQSIMHYGALGSSNPNVTILSARDCVAVSILYSNEVDIKFWSAAPKLYDSWALLPRFPGKKSYKTACDIVSRKQEKLNEDVIAIGTALKTAKNEATKCDLEDKKIKLEAELAKMAQTHSNLGDGSPPPLLQQSDNARTLTLEELKTQQEKIASSLSTYQAHLQTASDSAVQDALKTLITSSEKALADIAADIAAQIGAQE